jgi:RND family efflux transporter MFP subunit
MTQPAPSDLSRLAINRDFTRLTRRRRRKWLWLLGLAALALGGLAWYFTQPRPAAVETTPIVTTYPSQEFLVLNATGYVVAQRKAAIASKATGRLTWLGVAEGSRVKAGDIIARIDNRDVVAQAESAQASVLAARAALLQAQAEVRDAAAQLKRNEDLLAKGFVSPATVDTARWRADRAVAGVANAQAAIGVAEANARNAEVAVDYTLIRVPFDGVILSKSANVGDMVTPFSSAADSKGAVVSMADMSTLEVEADVSESSLAKIKVGLPCEITLDALPGERFRGRISRMVPTVDRAKATVMTKVQFETIDPRILPEMSAKVSFLSQDVTPEQQRPLTAVNPGALAARQGGSVVFLVKDGIAVLVPVTTGATVGGLVAISGAARTGDKAVLKPGPELVDRAPVRIAQK